MTVNEKLELLYRKNWENLSHALRERGLEDYAHPLLIRIDKNEERFERSDLKVMIFGQETKGWLTNTHIPEELNFFKATDKYDLRFLQREFAEGFYKKNKKSAFWQRGFKFFEIELGKIYKDRKIYFIWNNISKIGRNKDRTGVDQGVREIEQKNFAIVLEEIVIIKPDIVIFLTGPNRDSDILTHFRGAAFTTVNAGNTKKQLACVTLDNVLPKNTLRMYYPAYFGGFSKVKNNAISFFENNKI